MDVGPLRRLGLLPQEPRVPGTNNLNGGFHEVLGFTFSGICGFGGFRAETLEGCRAYFEDCFGPVVESGV